MESCLWHILKSNAIVKQYKINNKNTINCRSYYLSSISTVKSIRTRTTTTTTTTATTTTTKTTRINPNSKDTTTTKSITNSNEDILISFHNLLIGYNTTNSTTPVLFVPELIIHNPNSNTNTTKRNSTTNYNNNNNNNNNNRGHAIIGPNGCGKSLLSTIIVSLINKYTNNSISSTGRTIEDSNYQQNELTSNKQYVIYKGTMKVFDKNNHNNTNNEPVEIDISTKNTAATGTSSTIDNRSDKNNGNNNNYASSSTNKTIIEYVSFESHEQLLRSVKNKRNNQQSTPITTVYQILTPNGGLIPKSLQYLTIRFGFYKLLSNDILTLSTGEIRKLLLLQALINYPTILICDNIMDGLDVQSRTVVQQLLSLTIHGFNSKNDTLIQDISSKYYTTKTHVLFITHRTEELMNELNTISFITQNNTTSTSKEEDRNEQAKPTMAISTTTTTTTALAAVSTLHTEQRHGRSGDELMKEIFTNRLEQQNLRQSDNNNNNNNNNSNHHQSITNIPALPSIEEIQRVWNMKNNSINTSCSLLLEPIVTIQNLSIQRNSPSTTNSSSSSSNRRNVGFNKMSSKTDNEPIKTKPVSTSTTIIKDLDWIIYPNQHWLVAGGNGTGKSTISRGIANGISNEDIQYGSIIIKNIATIDENNNTYNTNNNNNIGWVSTELHLALLYKLRNEQNYRITAMDIIIQLQSVDYSTIINDIQSYLSLTQQQQQQQHEESKVTKQSTLTSTALLSTTTTTATATVNKEIAEQVTSWFFTAGTTNKNDKDSKNILNQPFLHLSQGEQKLILIISAIAKLPKLLILDEPLQGLDWYHRQLVLRLMERLCQATNNTNNINSTTTSTSDSCGSSNNNNNNYCSLLYITHHYEEVIPSISHVLHLKSGQSVYNGSIDTYDPLNYED